MLGPAMIIVMSETKCANQMRQRYQLSVRKPRDKKERHCKVVFVVHQALALSS